MYGKVGKELMKDYSSLYQAFEEITENQKILDELKLDKKTKETLLKYIGEKIKRREVKVAATLTITSQLSNGIEIIKNVMKEIQEKSKSSSIIYLGAPKYRLTLTSDNYKTAEKEVLEIKELGLSLIKNKGSFDLVRDDKRNS